MPSIRTTVATRYLTVILVIACLASWCRAQDGLERLRALGDAGDHHGLIVLADSMLGTLPQDDHEQRLAIQLLRSMGHYRTQDETGAMAAAQLAHGHARAIADTMGLVRALRIISELMFDGNRFEDALRVEREIFVYARSLPDESFLIKSYNNLANRFLMLEQRDSAEYYYREGLRRVKEDDVYGRAMLRSNIAKLLSERGDHDAAIGMMREAVEAMGSLGHEKLYKALNHLAYVYHNAGRHREAIAAFEESERLNALGERDIFVTMENLGFTAESHAALGEYKDAYAAMIRLEELLHEFYTRTANEELLELEKRYEAKLKQEEIERLDAENSEQAARLRARSQMLYGSLGLVLLVLVAAFLLWRNLRQKRRHASVLEELNTELRDQKERIEEINRLLQLKVLRTQMNPHFIYNCLNAINNLVRKGDHAGASSYLDGFARLLRMVLDHSVKDRVPISQELDFLRQYLKLESLRFEEGLRYDVDADRDLLDEDVDVPALLVQPFVENAVWHGLAAKEGEKRLSVRFQENGDGLRCVVEDNGVGRRAAPKRSHSDGSPSMGLQLTNERLQLLAYKLEASGRHIRFEDLQTPDGNAAGTRVELLLG